MFNRFNFVSVTLLAFLALMVAACAPTAAPTALPPTPTPAPQPSTAPAAGSKELVVFAASSLTDAFKEIGQAFQTANPGVTVTFNFAGSQVLSQQMIQGARADVFASANSTEMDKVRQAGLADNSGEIFVSNRLVVILPKDNPGKVNALKDLANPGLKLVIADKTVPVGGYALAMFDKMSADPTYGADFGPSVLKNVVSQENNVKAVVTKVALGEADAGIVYVTDATPDVMDKLTTLEVPDKYNQVGKYPIVVLKGASQPDLAKAFVVFVLAQDGGQAILQKWHFIPVN